MKISLAGITLMLSIACSAQISSQWETTINGNGDYGDQLHSVIADVNNNIYAVGSTVNTNTDRDWLIVKYNSQAQVIWKKIFSAPGNGPDEAKKVLIHPNGNIVVTGYGNNKSVGNDFWTMMLNPSGDTLWTRLYNSPLSNLYDEPNSMCLDGQGNIIITGDSDQDPTSFLNNDFLTVKYNATGNLIWAVKYNSPFNDNDRSMSVSTDNSNNIYITGRAFNGTDDDVVTIKYNSSGAQQWLKNFDNGGIDRPVSIGLDTQGKVYVAARSSNGTDDDYRVLCYNAQGTQQFNFSYDNAGHDRPVEMVVIPAGGCIVTGRSDGNPATGINYDIHTIAINSSGSQQWLATYSGNAGNDDVPMSVSLASDGKVVVCGYTDGDNSANISNNIISLTYASTGGSAITQTFNGSANKDDEGHCAVFCPNGAIAVVGFTSNSALQRDAIVLLYNSNNPAAAQNIFSGIGDNSQNVRDLTIDASGNTYISGYSVNKDFNRDFFIAKLNANGTVLWSADTTGTLFGSDEEANAIAIDNTGNICVSGYLKNSGTSSDIYVEKYNPNGSLIWNYGFDGTIHESDRSYNMTLDNTGNIYLCGKTDVDPSWQVNDDILLLKLSSSGVLSWSKVFNSVTLLDKAQFIRLNSSNEIIVAGKVADGINDNVIVLKYSNSGSLVWSYVLDCFGANDKLNDLDIQSNGDIIIGGQTQLSANGLDFNGFVASISAAGQQQWIQYVGATGVTMDEIIALDIASDNSIWATGNYDQDNTSVDQTTSLLVHYSSGGTMDTFGTKLFQNNNPNYADDLLLNNQDKPLITCHTNTANGADIDYQLEFLTWDGVNLASSYQRNVSDSIDVANQLKIDNATSTIYAGGSSWTTNGQRDALVGKYSWSNSNSIDDRISNIAIYPNPAQDCIHISGIQGFERCTIEIIDLQGRKLYSKEYYPHSFDVQIDIEHLSKGLYTVRIIEKGNTNTYQFLKS